MAVTEQGLQTLPLEIDVKTVASFVLDGGYEPNASELKALAQAYLDSQRQLANMLTAGVKAATGTLSYSETCALNLLFTELGDKTEGIMVMSKISDRAGVTRSVLVNALRKLESAGVITSRSLGMKGTFIRVLGSGLAEALRALL